MLKVGDKVVMNDKYRVSEETKEKFGQFVPSLGIVAEQWLY